MFVWLAAPFLGAAFPALLICLIIESSSDSLSFAALENILVHENRCPFPGLCLLVVDNFHASSQT